MTSLAREGLPHAEQTLDEHVLRFQDVLELVFAGDRLIERLSGNPNPQHFGSSSSSNKRIRILGKVSAYFGFLGSRSLLVCNFLQNLSTLSITKKTSLFDTCWAGFWATLCSKPPH